MNDPFYNPVLPSHVPPGIVYDFNIYDYEGRDPFEVIHEMHNAGLPEIFWTRNNGGHWVAFGADAISAVAQDPGSFSSERPIVPDQQNFDSPVFIPLVLDPPDHAAYRHVIAPLFHIRRIALLEESIRDFTDALILKVKEKGRCDFMLEFAEQMPIVVFLRLLDLPLEDRPRLLELAGNVVKPDEGGHRNDPIQEIVNYVRPIVEDRFAHPREDIISQIVTSTVQGRPLEVEEMVKLTTNVLLAGLETVSSALGFTAHYLATRPSIRQRLAQEPALIPGAVEEFLRRFSPAVTGRILTKDLTFRGIPMKRREHIVWAMAMFNLDNHHFDHPIDIDFARKRTQHAAFGAGVHFCLGAFLARMELRVFLERWLQAIPDFSLVSGATLEYRTGLAMSLRNLPLSIGANG